MSGKFLPVLLFLFVLACKPGEKAVTVVPVKALSGPEQSAYSLLYINATKEKILGNYDKASFLFNEAIKKDPSNPAAYYELAHLYYFTNNREQALSLAEKAAKLDPSNSWYQILVIGILEESGDYEGVAKYLEVLQVLQPGRLDIKMDYADALDKAGQMDKALKIYQELEEQVGINEELSRKKEMIYLRQNNLKQAVAEIEKLIAAYPAEPRYLAMLADIYRSNDQPDLAFAIYERMLKEDPENPFALLSLADHYKNSGDTRQAYAYLKRAYKNPALDIDTKVKILLSYYVLSEEDESLKGDAYELAEILVKTHPDEAKSFAVYGDFLLRDARYEEARNQFREAVKIDPSRLPVWTQLLLLENQLGDHQALFDESTQAIELFPENPSVYFFKGISAARLKKNKDAVENLEIAGVMVIDDAVLSSQIYSTLGDTYHAMGEHDKSDRAYEQSLSFEPDNAFVLNNYSYYLSQRGKNLDKAASMAKKANELDPGVSSFEDTYGWVLYRQGKFEESEKWLKKALISDGERSAVILEHYGDVLSKLGRNAEAIEYWKKALERSPENQTLKNKSLGQTGP